MGTNYYIKPNVCPTCGRGDTEIHLGKSSFGWKFSFQYNGGQYYKNVEEMKTWLRGKQIWDEYGHKVTKKEFWEMIEAKQKVTNPSTDWGSHAPTIINGYVFHDGQFS